MLIANPHNVSPDAEAELEARARLPVDHPEYIPTEACPPKLLFPEARKHDLRRRTRATIPEPSSPTPAAGRRRAGSSSSDGSRAPGPSKSAPEEDESEMKAAMATRMSARMRKGIFADGENPRTRPSSQQGDSPRMPEKDRSDPVKRALGPYRPA